jgi:hypothetical protein
MTARVIESLKVKSRSFTANQPGNVPVSAHQNRDQSRDHAFVWPSTVNIECFCRRGSLMGFLFVLVLISGGLSYQEAYICFVIGARRYSSCLDAGIQILSHPLAVLAQGSRWTQIRLSRLPANVKTDHFGAPYRYQPY